MSELREIPCSPPPLPPGIAAALADGAAGQDWARSTVGESGGNVWRLTTRQNGEAFYLNHGEDDVAAAIAAETERLRWLSPHVPVPRVVAFDRDRNAAWLLMTALPGRTAWQVLSEEPARAGEVVDALAAFLRCFHVVPANGCPFDSGAAIRMAEARARIDAGLIDPDDFDDERAGWSAEDVWQALIALPQPSDAPVISHGDFSLDNIIVADGRITGCIDVGRAGLADRYQDIAILWNNLGEFGEEMQDRLLIALGEGRGDKARLDWHLLLDELF